MPEPPKEGETHEEFMKRCVPIFKEEGESSEKATEMCNAMWYNSKQSDNSEYEEFSYEVPLQITTEEVKVNNADGKDYQDQSKTITKHAVALIGDHYVASKNHFMPASTVEQSKGLWNKKLLDINHMGTTRITPLGVLGGDIRYFVGWQDNVQYDYDSKKLTMDIHIDRSTDYGNTLYNYINLCEKAGKIPNVSVSFFAKKKLVKATELPIDFQKYGLNKESYVYYMYDLKPRALSVVFEGAYSDKDGCGIGKSVDNGKEEPNKELEAEKQKLIEELKKLDNEE
ncbi:MAG: hypothetical protein ACOC80_13810 [Petrotogales bacterium]